MQLIKRIATGDSRALEAIIDKYSAYVQAIASNITIPPLQKEDVEEIASDVFYALWKNADSVEPGKVKSYLAAIARNTAINKLRSNHLAVPLEEDYMIITVPDAEEHVLEQEIQQLAHQAVASLPEPDQSIFKRFYFLYQKAEDIAHDLNINPATVRTKLRRGRARLKEYIKERGYECEISDC